MAKERVVLVLSVRRPNNLKESFVCVNRLGMYQLIYDIVICVGSVSGSFHTKFQRPFIAWLHLRNYEVERLFYTDEKGLIGLDKLDH